MRIVSPTGKKIYFDSKKVIFKEPPPTSVVIGEHTYGVVQIGNLYWTAENLYEPLPSFGSLNNGADYDSVWANFPTLNDNSQGYGILYYNGGIILNRNDCRTYLLSLVPRGWRIPTVDDCNDLIASVSSWKDLVTVEAGGNNSTGFGMGRTGTSARNWNYVNEQGMPSGQGGFIIDNEQYNYFINVHQNSSYNLTLFHNTLLFRCPIRLCKDI